MVQTCGGSSPTLLPGVREGDGGLLPPAGHLHPLPRCWDGVQARRPAGGGGPVGPALVAGPQAALCCALRRTHSFRQQTEEVKVNVGLTTSDPEQNERSNVLQSERLKVKRRSSALSFSSCLLSAASRGSSGGASPPTFIPASGPVSTHHPLASPAVHTRTCAMIVLHFPLVCSRWHRCNVVLCVDPLTPVADQGGCQCQSVSVCGRS